MRTTLYFLLLCLLPIRASLAGITISESVVSEDETSVWIDAQFSYQIDEQVVEAIKNGIPLVFRAEYRIEEVRPLWEENLIIERIDRDGSVQVVWIHPAKHEYEPDKCCGVC